MSDKELATPEMFEQFIGIEHYFNYNNQYAYTDGLKYIEDHVFDHKDFLTLINVVISNMSYRYPFGAFELEILDSKQGKALFKVKNENNVVKRKIELEISGLKEGTYKIFCYNYVILAASEY